MAWRKSTLLVLYSLQVGIGSVVRRAANQYFNKKDALRIIPEGIIILRIVKLKFTTTMHQPGILEIYFSICLIWSTICGVVGFSAFALRKKSFEARNSRLFIMMLHIWR